MNGDVAKVALRVMGALAIIAGVVATSLACSGLVGGGDRARLGPIVGAGAVLIVGGLGTAWLRGTFALFLTVPFLLLGARTFVGVISTGSLYVIAMNLFITVPVLCGPFVVIVWCRRSLRWP